MKTKKVNELPKCSFKNDYPHPNGDDAIYDAPVVPSGSWAYMCKECGMSRGNLKMATKLELRNEISKSTNPKIQMGIEENSLEYWENVLMDGLREIECPECGESRNMEPDATGVFKCEGCHAQVRCPMPIF